MMPIELWYIDVTTNNHNSRAYLDMINDIRVQRNGPFTCTMKLNEGMIVDYVVIENAQYVDPAPTKAN